jgi:hypothetical protein
MFVHVLLNVSNEIGSMEFYTPVLKAPHINILYDDNAQSFRRPWLLLKDGLVSGSRGRFVAGTARKISCSIANSPFAAS